MESRIVYCQTLTRSENRSCYASAYKCLFLAWTAEEVIIEFLCTSGICLMSDYISLCLCMNLCAEQPKAFQNKTSASTDTIVSSLSSVRCEASLTQRLSLVTRGLVRPIRARVGACILPWSIANLVCEIHSTVVSLMLTRCCQDNGL